MNTEEIAIEKLKNRNDFKALDEFIFNEIFCANHYSVHQSDIIGKRVIDVGANVGMFSALCLEYGAKSILLIEACPLFIDILNQTLNEYINLYRDIDIINFAAYDNSKEYVNIENGDNKGLTKVIDDSGIIVKTITLDSALKYVPQNDNNLVLKIDIEGSEHQFLKGQDLSRFQTIFIEIHGNDIDKNNLCDYIISQGFKEINKSFMLVNEWINGVLKSYVREYIIKYSRSI